MVSPNTNTETGARLNSTNSVDAYMAALDHPLKAEIETIRAIIRAADARITELIKWNAPSFYFKDDFATFRLRPIQDIQVILHRGAKVKDNSTGGMQISDPSGLLRWLAKDRAVVTFSDMEDIKSKEAALVDIVQQWIAQM